MRPIVQYDDISLSYDDNDGNGDDKEEGSSVSPPAAKKRKTYEIEEESRELTHEEIWDDSALIDAWNAAAEEYEAYHGPDKGWKNEPVNKSPLRWYNTPPSKPKSAQTQPKQVTFAESPQKPQKSSNMNGKHVVKSENKEADSAPIDFDTFVPSHDPSLDQIQGGGAPSAEMLNYYTSLAELPPGQTVSQDEAFSRAMQAMYWGGYWTAVYHYQRKQEQDTLLAAAAEDERDGEEEE